MPRADRVLFASYLRIARSFYRASLPLTGLVGTEVTFWSLDPFQSISQLFRHPPAGIAFTGGEVWMSFLIHWLGDWRQVQDSAGCPALRAPVHPFSWIAEGARLLSRLQFQLETLEAAEDHTREVGPLDCGKGNFEGSGRACTRATRTWCTPPCQPFYLQQALNLEHLTP
jgi:hypothetical protein